MKTGNVAVTLCLALLASAALAQEETFFSEVMEIRVTNVDVIVTGRDGKPVTGLTRDDFELYEDGVRKDISNFLELRGDGAPALTTVPGQAAPAVTPASQDIRRRDITIFIDNVVLHPLRRNVVLPHLRQFLEQNVRPGDSVAIVTSGSSLKVELEPTSDRAAMEAAVERLGGQTTMGAQAGYSKDDFYRAIAMIVRAYKDRGEDPPWFEAINEVRSYAMRLTHDVRRRAEALKSVLSWRRGAEGRKVLVYLTEALPQNPAEAEFMYLDSISEVFKDVSGSAMGESKEFEMPTLVHEIAQAANSSGVTLYPIDAAGKNSGTIDRGADSTLRISPSGRVEQAAVMMTLRTLAAETGGVALEGSSNWKLAFDTISNDLETYYSLGYRSTGERQDRMKNIEVKLKNKRFNVRTRRAVIEKSIASEMHDAVAANLFRTSSSNDLSISASVGASTVKDPESVVIPLTVTIPLEKLTLMPDGTDLTARFAIYAAFLRKDGAVSKVAQQPGSVRFPAESLKRRKELTVKIDVTADTRTNGLSVGVIDELSRATGFAAVKLE